MFQGISASPAVWLKFNFPAACDCDPEGSRSLQCRENGHCECKEGFVGSRCNQCEENYFYNRSWPGCQECPACYRLVKDKVRPQPLLFVPLEVAQIHSGLWLLKAERLCCVIAVLCSSYIGSRATSKAAGVGKSYSKSGYQRRGCDWWGLRRAAEAGRKRSYGVAPWSTEEQRWVDLMRHGSGKWLPCLMFLSPLEAACFISNQCCAPGLTVISGSTESVNVIIKTTVAVLLPMLFYQWSLLYVEVKICL